ncbi:hypothetical protein JHK84_027703 [Glycine max]|nr:hypothetical protein JHK86_027576 [Glycine max]KAG5151231.1 hypothetical protein JHK84_027703 [Glycine max]
MDEVLRMPCSSNDHGIQNWTQNEVLILGPEHVQESQFPSNLIAWDEFSTLNGKAKREWLSHKSTHCNKKTLARSHA